jgi:hypothetical protein
MAGRLVSAVGGDVPSGRGVTIAQAVGMPACNVDRRTALADSGCAIRRNITFENALLSHRRVAAKRARVPIISLIYRSIIGSEKGLLSVAQRHQDRVILLLQLCINHALLP